VNPIFASVPLNALLLKDGSKEVTTQVAEARLALPSSAVFARHAKDMVGVLMVDGTLLPICLHACALLPFVPTKNVVSLCATLQPQVSVEVGNDLRILMAN